MIRIIFQLIEYLQENPDLRITLDISHWCNVSESLLEDQPDTVELAISRTDHIHSRVGHAEGPQVGDPRAPEWKASALVFHHVHRWFLGIIYTYRRQCY